MFNLDSLEDIKKLDTQNVLGSIEELSKQVSDAYNESNKVIVPGRYRDINNIVMCGMGGSGLGARVIESIYGNEMRYPLVRVNDYNLPGFVNKRSLVICSSYSGETEETIQNARQSIEKQAKWMAIGTGNTLIKMAQENNAPFFQISPKYNPSNQPRMAIGYNIIGQLVLVAKAGVINLNENDISVITNSMDKISENNNAQNLTDKNEAKKLSLLIKNKIIIFISGEHLTGAAHIVNNQHNENAKNLTFDFAIPELNHHLMEGLKHPDTNKNNIFIIFFDSELYSERIKKRFEITKEVVTKNNIDNYTFTASSINKLSQSFEIIQFGSFVNFYLTMLYEQDPAPITWVDYFKEKLGQPLGK
jgi:glucose/mannose-6-phosphate isomerase